MKILPNRKVRREKFHIRLIVFEKPNLFLRFRICANCRLKVLNNVRLKDGLVKLEHNPAKLR